MCTNFHFEFLGPNLPKNRFWGRNFKNLRLDSESASLRYYMQQFSDKTDNFEFLGPDLPRNRCRVQNLKNLSPNQHPGDTICTNFLAKGRTLNFWAQICPKMNFVVGISKISV